MEKVLTSPCIGMNCGCTDGVSHSLECHAQHAAAIAGGVFVKAAKPETERAERAEFVACSMNGKQHDTGRVETKRGGFFASTANPEDARRIADALNAALLSAEPKAGAEPVARECTDPMCACRGGPCAECPEGMREKEIDDLRSSLDFYKHRADALQQTQKHMRDPERTMVCDILANGHLLEPAGDRYTRPQAADAQPLTDLAEKFERMHATGNQWITTIAAAKLAYGITGKDNAS